MMPAMPAAMMSAPAIVTPRPNRGASRAAAPEEISTPTENGRKVRPACSGVKPRPSCRNSVSTSPNEAIPMKNVTGMAIAVTFFMGIASFGLVLTLFLQLGLGFTPLHSGLTFLPFSVGVLFSSTAAARLAPRFGRGVTMAGALIIAGGMAVLIADIHHYGAAVSTWDLVPGLVAAGFGLGAVIAPLADIVLARVPKQDAGSASGVFNTGLQLGNSIGIAVIGVIFFGMLGTQSGAAATSVAPALRTNLVAAGMPAQYTAPIETQFRACLHDRLVAADPTVTPA